MRRTVLIYTIAEFTASEPDYFYHAKLFAGTHHEKRNGSGCPNGLSGKEILLQGRLMAIADVYDALISKRPYKEPFEHKAAAEIIINYKSSRVNRPPRSLRPCGRFCAYNSSAILDYRFTRLHPKALDMLTCISYNIVKANRH